MQMEFEDVLPYSEFALRVPEYATYRLPHMMQEIMDTPGKVIIWSELFAAHLKVHSPRAPYNNQSCSFPSF